VGEPSQRVVARFVLRMCAFDSRFASLLFPTGGCGVGKSLSLIDNLHVVGGLRFVGHLHCGCFYLVVVHKGYNVAVVE